MHLQFYDGYPFQGVLSILIQIAMYIVLPLIMFGVAFHTQLKVDDIAPMRYREQKIHQDVLTVIIRMVSRCTCLELAK